MASQPAIGSIRHEIGALLASSHQQHLPRRMHPSLFNPNPSPSPILKFDPSQRQAAAAAGTCRPVQLEDGAKPRGRKKKRKQDSSVKKNFSVYGPFAKENLELLHSFLWPVTTLLGCSVLTQKNNFASIFQLQHTCSQFVFWTIKQSSQFFVFLTLETLIKQQKHSSHFRTRTSTWMLSISTRGSHPSIGTELWFSTLNSN